MNILPTLVSNLVSQMQSFLLTFVVVVVVIYVISVLVLKATLWDRYYSSSSQTWKSPNRGLLIYLNFHSWELEW